MALALKTRSFPAPQALTPEGTDPQGSVSRWRAVDTAVRALARTDLMRRSGALIAFAIAVLIVMLSASSAVAQTDSDGDGLSDSSETSIHQTDPKQSDTDGDGLADGVEVSLGTDPLSRDTDGDGVSDVEEYLAGRDPLVAAVPPGTSVPPVTTAVQSLVQTPFSPAADGSHALAFDDSGDRSSLYPLYIVLAVAVGVGMFAALARLPEMGHRR